MDRRTAGRAIATITAIMLAIGTIGITGTAYATDDADRPMIMMEHEDGTISEEPMPDTSPTTDGDALDAQAPDAGTEYADKGDAGTGTGTDDGDTAKDKDNGTNADKNKDNGTTKDDGKTTTDSDGKTTGTDAEGHTNIIIGIIVAVIITALAIGAFWFASIRDRM